MILWLRPDYPSALAQTELEGTILLSLHIRPNADTYGIQIERTSGSARLDASAMLAAKSWKFTPARWQGQPIESQVMVELTFRFFEYEDAHIDETTATTASINKVHSPVRQDRRMIIRTLAEDLRSKSGPDSGDGSQAVRDQMRDWGPVSGVEYLGSIASPEWRRYTIKSQFAEAGGATAAVVRWELYKVIYGSHTALWEIAVDRAGRLWATKAEPLKATDLDVQCSTEHVTVH